MRRERVEIRKRWRIRPVECGEAVGRGIRGRIEGWSWKLEVRLEEDARKRRVIKGELAAKGMLELINREYTTFR